ncbi:MAG: hypothetical protein NC251_11425 [Lachnoclostridium sp.]|nr:hypothetical protein [Lachnospira sp.]MCM1249030.1 hypothetical protein [Lachnoclostridium sp.]MCM1535898.1 hypothetical protein [Clostridium sp.]
MVRTEMKRAFGSKAFRATCIVTLIMLAFASSDYLPPPHSNIKLPEPWWIFYFHCFFLGMKTALPVFYPIVVMIPYVLSYRQDRDSGYRKLILLKTSRKAYLGAKALAVWASAFAAILLPSLAWIPACRLIGDTDWDYALEYYAHNINFLPDFYREHVVLYCVMYAFHAAILGAVFALLGLGISAVVKNKYLALFLPFCYAIFSSSILTSLFRDTFIGKSFEVMNLMPLQTYCYTDVYPLGYWTVPVYEAALAAVGLILYLGGDYYVGKA